MQPPRTIPGLKADEGEVLKAYIRTLDASQVTRIEYNVRLGDGVTFESAPPEIARMAKMITQLRADAMIFTHGSTWIIESKVRADAQAIGQLLTYRDLWMRANPDLTSPTLAIVCSDYHPDMKYTADLHNIKLIKVGTGG